jgi:arsenate reductase
LKKPSVLFVCVHNSARSQIAEAFLHKWAGDRFEVESAGLEPGTLNPLAVEAMRQVGIDISSNQTKSVFDFFRQGKIYRYVITVCDEASAEQCPVFPGMADRINWSFPDPSRFQGTWEEQLAQAGQLQDEIEAKIRDWLSPLPAD